MVIRCRAWPEKHIDQEPAYMILAPFIPCYSLFFMACSSMTHLDLYLSEA